MEEPGWIEVGTVSELGDAWTPISTPWRMDAYSNTFSPGRDIRRSIRWIRRPGSFLGRRFCICPATRRRFPISVTEAHRYTSEHARQALIAKVFV